MTRMDVSNIAMSQVMLVLFMTLIVLGAVPAARADDTRVSATTTDDGSLTLKVDVDTTLHITTPRYLSITISGGQLRKGLIGYDFGSQKLENLAAALGPADVRIGGTYGDFLIFDPTSSQANCVDVKAMDESIEDSENIGDDDNIEQERDAKTARFNAGKLDFTMSGKRWDNVTRFTDKVGWAILWDFNLLGTSLGRWNCSQAEVFLKYSASRGVKIPMFELGNEPNLYERKFDVDIAAQELVEDYKILKNVIAPSPQYSASGLYAPGVNNLDTFQSPRKYLQQFLENGGCDIITEVSLHHYYFSAAEVHGDAVKMFLSKEILDSLEIELDFAYNISTPACNMNKPIRFTETSSASGGGVKDVSNAYVAGFLWLDKLGLSAKYGITRVFRQTFLKSSYALVTQRLRPNPDYYLSVLFKRLVVGPVFPVESQSDNVRLYAHCVSKSHYSYPDGAIVVYYLNIGSEASTLSLGQFQDDPIYLFQLTPGDDEGMVSRYVKLNDELLEMDGDELPSMEPKTHTGDVQLAGETFGFIVFPDAGVQACLDYHRNDDGVDVSC